MDISDAKSLVHASAGGIRFCSEPGMAILVSFAISFDNGQGQRTELWVKDIILEMA